MVEDEEMVPDEGISREDQEPLWLEAMPRNGDSILSEVGRL